MMHSTDSRQISEVKQPWSEVSTQMGNVWFRYHPTCKHIPHIFSQKLAGLPKACHFAYLDTILTQNKKNVRQLRFYWSIAQCVIRRNKSDRETSTFWFWIQVIYLFISFYFFCKSPHFEFPQSKILSKKTKQLNCFKKKHETRQK